MFGADRRDDRIEQDPRGVPTRARKTLGGSTRVREKVHGLLILLRRNHPTMLVDALRVLLERNRDDVRHPLDGMLLCTRGRESASDSEDGTKPAPTDQDGSASHC